MPTVIFSNGSKAWANNLNDLRERWQLRREEPVRYTVPVELFKIDIEKMSRDNLLKLVSELNTLSVTARKALRDAHVRRGKPNALSKSEFFDLSNTVDAIGNHILLANNRLSEFGLDRKGSLQRMICDVCQERLPQDVWQGIIDEARKRISGLP